MNNYKIGILTSNMLRHRYMVNPLSDEFDIDFIISKKKLTLLIIEILQ